MEWKRVNRLLFVGTGLLKYPGNSPIRAVSTLVATVVQNLLSLANSLAPLVSLIWLYLLRIFSWIAKNL